MHIYAQEYVTLFFYREITIISIFEREEQHIYSWLLKNKTKQSKNDQMDICSP